MGSPLPAGPWCPSAPWPGQSVCPTVFVPSLRPPAHSQQDPAAPSCVPVFLQVSHPSVWLGTHSIRPQQCPSHPRLAHIPRRQ